MPFDPVLAKQMAQISNYVYRVKSSEPPAFADDEADIARNKTSVTAIAESDPKGTSFAAVLRYTDKTVLAFQGTIFHSWADWLEDFRAEYNENPEWQLGLPGKIHEGFAHQLLLINDQILADLGKGYEAPLYVTGHSQGAALAVLATAWLIQQKPSVAVEATYTFAAPRAGDVDFAKALVGQSIYRVEFGDDIVPYVPLTAIEQANWANNPFNGPKFQRLITTIANGYVAAGALIYRGFGLHETLQTEWTAETEATLVAERRKRLARAGALSLVNHMMANYIAMFDDNMWRTIAASFTGPAAEKLHEAEDKLRELAGKIPIPKVKLPFQ